MAILRNIIVAMWLLAAPVCAVNNRLWFQRDTSHDHDIWVAHLGSQVIWTENANGPSHHDASTGTTILECLDYLLVVDGSGKRIRKLETAATFDYRVVLLHNGILTYTVGTQIIGAVSWAQSNAAELLKYLRGARFVRSYDIRRNLSLREHLEIEYGLPLAYFRSNLVCLKILNLRQALAHHNKKVDFGLVFHDYATGCVSSRARLRISRLKSRLMLLDVLGFDPFPIPTVSVKGRRATVTNLFGQSIRADMVR